MNDVALKNPKFLKIASQIIEANQTLMKFVAPEDVVGFAPSDVIQASVPGNENQMSVVVVGSNRTIPKIASDIAVEHRDDQRRREIDRRYSEFDLLNYPLIFHDGNDGFGRLPDESYQLVCKKIFKAYLCLIVQPRNHFIHYLGYLREELICVTFARGLNIRLD
jgi:hypothetical protein